MLYTNRRGDVVMYNIDDLVVYGVIGVCRVRDITHPSFDEQAENLYYVLEPLYQSGLIYTPIDNDHVYIRPILSREEADSLIDQMASMDVEIIKSRSVQQLSKHYQDIINSHDILGLVKLKKSIDYKMQVALEKNRKLGDIDKRYIKKIEELLFGELAVALRIERENVQSYIDNRLTMGTLS